MDAAETHLSNALLAMVSGSRPTVSLAQVQEHMQRYFGLSAETFQVCHSFLDDFIMIFNDGGDLVCVLHVEPAAEGGFSLFFQWWMRQARGCFSPLYFKVGYVIQELEEPFIEREPPMFLSASEIIHSKKDMLQF
jgi:hypothetical protein